MITLGYVGPISLPPSLSHTSTPATLNRARCAANCRLADRKNGEFLLLQSDRKKEDSQKDWRVSKCFVSNGEATGSLSVPTPPIQLLGHIYVELGLLCASVTRGGRKVRMPWVRNGQAHPLDRGRSARFRPFVAVTAARSPARQPFRTFCDVLRTYFGE